MRSFLFFILYGLSSLNCYSQYNINTQKKNNTKWKIRLYASHSFTKYYNTDIKFTSSRYNVEIKNYEWLERGSREFFQYKKWSEQGNNPLQIIDEPSNTFILSIEKNSHELFISIFHPKFIQNPWQIVYMKGEIDGSKVEGFYNINRPFDGYNQFPGEMELVRNENTNAEILLETGYGYRFKLIGSKIGYINYVPSIGLGISYGKNLVVVIKKNEWWEFDNYKQKTEFQGFGGSIINRIEFNTEKERFGVFYENKLSYYKQNHGFIDGNQKYNLKLTGNSVGIKFMIYNLKRSSI